jgi:hypothetical protein
MDEQPSVPPTIPSTWKGTVVRCAAWGVGFGIGAGLVFVAFAIYTGRPKGWDDKSLRASNVKAGALAKLDEQWTATSTGSIFTVDLQNTTWKDITLPTSVTIMETAKGTGALNGSLLKLSHDYFLPARHTVTITLENDGECSPTDKAEECFNSYFKDERDIVLFDQSQKYEISIPIPPLTPGNLQLNPPPQGRQ